MAEEVNPLEQRTAGTSDQPPLKNPYHQQVFARRQPTDFPNLSPGQAEMASSLSDQVDIFTGERRPGAEVDMFGRP